MFWCVIETYPCGVSFTRPKLKFDRKNDNYFGGLYILCLPLFNLELLIIRNETFIPEDDSTVEGFATTNMTSI